jgi:polyhydroxyalkanoate synthesis regulator phasin
MLYLAQVHKNEFLDQHQLQLLARQEAENVWTIIPEEAFILLGKGSSLAEKLLVLVELSATGDIEKIEEATNWVLNLVQTYLSTGITPEFLHQEAERAEQWRQNLTLQNQDLARRSLELEARREQIQALEETLKREKNGLPKDESGPSVNS